MPQQSTILTINNADEGELQLLAMETLSRLNWNVDYSGGGILVAFTPRKWNKWESKIVIEIKYGSIRITSMLIHGEFLDLFQKNKKNISEFAAAIEQSRTAAANENAEERQKKRDKLNQASVAASAEDTNPSEEDSLMMPVADGKIYITYGIIIINAILFLAMIMSKVHIFSPTSIDIARWGGNISILTFGGDWWRLISSMFIHIGILHLLLNMYALYMIGSWLEPLLGKLRFLTAFFCSGVMASLVSVVWHKNDMTVSAGASGAVFGLAGVLLALLTTNVLPKQARAPLLPSILLFTVYNLFYGLKEGSSIDNAAHIGGLLTGLLIGYAYYFTYKRPTEGKTQLVTTLLASVVLVAVILMLRAEKSEPIKMDSRTGTFYTEKERTQKAEDEKFDRIFKHYDALASLSREMMRYNDTLSNEVYLKNLKKTSLPDWADCVNLMDEAGELKLSPGTEQLRKDLAELAKQRARQTMLMIRMMEERTPKYRVEIDSLESAVRTIKDGLPEEMESY